MKNNKSIVLPIKAEITCNQRISNKSYIVSFKREFNFQPGQVIKITIDKNIPPRLYSIASGNQEAEIRILYDVVEQGQLTPALSTLQKGDIIYISEPFGKFICKEEKAHWIATGTGIAPYASMFYSGMQKGKTLIHGGRSMESFYFQNDFIEMGNQYIRCCSKEKNDQVYYGRVTDYLISQENLPKDQKYYLCGNAEMVVNVRDILIEKGIPFNQIIAEIYF